MTRSQDSMAYNCLSVDMKQIFESSRGSYGSRRMSKALRALGYDIGRYKADQMMKELGLVVRKARKFKVTTNSKHKYPVAENLLNREFTVSAPDKAWVVDITYLWTREGWVYLAAVVDLYSRKIVGWAMSHRMTTDLALDALRMAYWCRKPKQGLLHHSDRGSQYASHNYQNELKKYHMVCSMSRKGNCWDNAVMERFFGSLKREQTDHHNYSTRRKVIQDVNDYIMFYNNYRLHSYLGYCSPVDFESQNVKKEA
ncbi:IS3 family transposase [Endozoicomonas sp.]|uniref:IS3 family transposase n=1 Tax=Endozoicomonas sp. TaxID=1892382 RepID=UPI00383B0D8F